MREPWARHRELLRQGITRCLERDRSSSGTLVTEQVEASDGSDYQQAALVCLAAAQAVGSPPEAALSGAVSLAFISQMALVFTSLESSGGLPSLSTAWGMPRTLNAGDAMFALAQESLLAGDEELPGATRLAALGVVDRAGRVLVAYLHANAGRSFSMAQRALLPSAMSLGALCGGADAAARKRLEDMGALWATLPDDELARLLASDPAGWLAT